MVKKFIFKNFYFIVLIIISIIGLSYFLFSYNENQEILLDIVTIENSTIFFEEENKIDFDNFNNITFENNNLNLNYSKYFISIWDTTLNGITNHNQIILPLEKNGSYNFTVVSDNLIGSPLLITNYSQRTLTFFNTGIQILNISGDIIGWSFNNSGDKEKIIEISSWGSLNLGNNENYFYGAKNLKITSYDNLNLSGTKSLKNMFRMPEENNFNILGNIDNWNLSNIENFDSLFLNANLFNSKIGNWDTSNVKNMENMFVGASNFNQNLNSWNVSRVSDMSNMFLGARNFNQPLNNWDVSNVKNMRGIFTTAVSFNQPLDNWNVSSVTNMRSMFTGAILFNQPLDSWDVRKVEDTRLMFQEAFNFNQPLDSWDVSNVKNMWGMFSSATSFNQPLNSWNTSTVIDMRWMFLDATSFNQNLTSWCVTNIALEPTDFATSSPLDTNGLKPIWGTCP